MEDIEGGIQLPAKPRTKGVSGRGISHRVGAKFAEPGRSENKASNSVQEENFYY